MSDGRPPVWPAVVASVGVLVALAVIVALVIRDGQRSAPVVAAQGTDSGAATMADPPRPLRDATPEERERLDAELATVRAAVSWRTVGDALDAGFVLTTVDPAHPDDHLVLADRVDDRFDLAEPEMLIAAGNDRSAPIVAVVYWVEGSDAPEGFAGPTDPWHRHPAACSAGGNVSADGASGDPAVCVAHGGTVVSPGGWMVHAWVVPGFRNGAGTFAVNDADLDDQVREWGGR